MFVNYVPVERIFWKVFKSLLLGRVLMTEKYQTKSRRNLGKRAMPKSGR